jgi:hypothetical protein
MAGDDQDICEVLDQINQSLSSIDKKIDQLTIDLRTESDQVDDRSSICTSAGVDMIDRFRKELATYDVKCDLTDGLFNLDQALNKATYYFENYRKITNHRAYLVKLCGQIDQYSSPSHGETVQEKADHILTDDQKADYLGKFETLTPEQIETIRFNDERIAWLLTGKKGSNYPAMTKIMIIMSGIKQGVIS